MEEQSDAAHGEFAPWVGDLLVTILPCTRYWWYYMVAFLHPQTLEMIKEALANVLWRYEKEDQVSSSSADTRIRNTCAMNGRSAIIHRYPARDESRQPFETSGRTSRI